MLAIRMQRVGRKGHPEFRVVVQDSRVTPTSGRIVARVGSVNPHTKTVALDKEKVEYYLKNGARPSERVVRMLQSEKFKLPEWVEIPANTKKRSIKNVEKLRRNRPVEEVVEETSVAETESNAEESKVESPATDEPEVEETPATEEASTETTEA